MDHLYVVSLPKDETTLRNKAKDCVTLGTLQVGDEVIVCEKCRLTGIYRKKDWTGHCQFCGGSETLRFPNGMDAVFFPAKVLGGAKQNHAQKQTPPRSANQNPNRAAAQSSSHRSNGDDPNTSGWASCLVSFLVIGAIAGGILFVRGKLHQQTAEVSYAEYSAEPSPTVSYPDTAVTFRSHVYNYYDISLSWTEAEQYCEELGGHLASIHSDEEQNFIQSLTQDSAKKNIWIGGKLEGGSWKWSDGTLFDYLNWDINKPDNYRDEEYFLRYANDDLYFETWSAIKGRWDDCAENGSGSDSDAPLSTFGFVCEWDP